ncbi:hypothetical protein E9993_00255 [Labilibacter sediminis]|nr:hypothetical protein E9993_00255 [Labilibacter sediminis]
MKKLMILTMALLIGVASFANQSASETEQKFVGKWNMLWKDLPDGDLETILELKIVDDKLVGEITGDNVIEQMGEPIKLYDIEVDGEELSFMYTSQGYDVSIVVELESDTSFSGFMMDMFEVEGDKIKE